MLRPRTLVTSGVTLSLFGPLCLAAVLLFGFWYLSPTASRASSSRPDRAEPPTPPSRSVSAFFAHAGAQAEPERAASLTTEPALRVLLLGSDARSGSPLQGRPDTILVVVLPDESSRVGVISVPRDLWIEPLDAPAHRINETLQVARSLGEDPLERMKRVVGDTLALPLDHTVAVSMGGFIEAVDAVGGIDVDVPCPIRDRFVDAGAPGGRRLLDVAAGRQHLDGITANMYVRSRHGRSDFGRARRQQAVVAAMKERLMSSAGLMALPGLLGLVSRSTVSDLSPTELARLAAEARGRSLSTVHGVVIGWPEAKPHRTDEGKAVLLLDEEAAHIKIAGLFGAPSAGIREVAAPCPAADVGLGRNW